MNDRHIRRALKMHLLAPHAADANTVILDELGLGHGVSRVDVAVVSNALHGYEIKSDCDTLQRLPDQVRIYNRFLDCVTLIVGYRHAYNALQVIPIWWGVYLVEMNNDGSVHFEAARDAKNNPSLDKYAVASLLWRKEALSLLEELGRGQGMRSKPRREIYMRLASVVDFELLRARVRQQLKHRAKTRSDAGPSSYDD
jgi:hypothetical protein